MWSDQQLNQKRQKSDKNRPKTTNIGQKIKKNQTSRAVPFPRLKWSSRPVPVPSRPVQFPSRPVPTRVAFV
eukprot:2180949-Karenia_brevis.AAC.1